MLEIIILLCAKPETASPAPWWPLLPMISTTGRLSTHKPGLIPVPLLLQELQLSNIPSCDAHPA